MNTVLLFVNFIFLSINAAFLISKVPPEKRWLGGLNLFAIVAGSMALGLIIFNMVTA